MSAFDDLVGIPWCAGGRDRAGADCLGLVEIAYRELLGLTLPAHADAIPSDHDAVRQSVAAARETWVHVEDPRPFDVVLLRERPWHLGLVVERGLMLHMPEGLSSKVESYATGRHLARVEGFYRLATGDRENVEAGRPTCRVSSAGDHILADDAWARACITHGGKSHSLAIGPLIGVVPDVEDVPQRDIEGRVWDTRSLDPQCALLLEHSVVTCGLGASSRER